MSAGEAMKWPRLLAAATGLLLAGLFAGYLFRGGGPASPAHAPAQAAAAVQFWTCSMHPEVKLPGHGKCPKCGMDLVPVQRSSGDGGDDRPRLTLSPGARELAGIETAPVERRAVAAELRLTGRVDYDETRMRRLTARYAGRIERLPGTFIGSVVKKGAPLADVYSPDLLAAQEELLQAARLAAVKSGGEYLAGLSARTLDAAREKLLLLGLSKEQVAEVERSGKAAEHVTMLAPLAGTVTMKSVNEGDYVETGREMFAIADLSRVWIMLDAYESDLALLAVGQEAEFTTPALPGASFKARVAFIDPAINPGTRTARARLEADNPDGRLKPGTFGYGIVRLSLAEPGQPLPLVVPATAPLVTGRRAVVYVEDPQAERPTYEGRVVMLGPRAGDWQVVLDGLAEGERVVTRGSFKIDSALQIEAKPSMMSLGDPTDRTTPSDRPDGQPRAPAALRPQETCPVMGGKIDRKVFVDHGGRRIYFCCPGCDAAFRSDPERYLKALRDRGEEPEPAPAPAAAPGGTHRH